MALKGHFLYFNKVRHSCHTACFYKMNWTDSLVCKISEGHITIFTSTDCKVTS